ncbi:glutamate-5-semialdehyde dehydrogenase [Candidatus Bathycorpusculum sp.]|uniref:glutamate-5-semialdehyde dehydrogenase n=1 Tax=Candidatus Bathycorpusculum sp. TaxID=2994959 RepID=UPI0028367801|nr:glutamate-5-semialdehyde dehydrogenase [Candidatus Termitimicrobium sp.]MCL2432562.1 glutamate-5-semialdehyde dehydrogenase [Candidatus Termitimicrobium sp.]
MGMIEQICIKAKATTFEMGKLSATAKNTALLNMANALENNTEKILEANKLDVEAAKARGLKVSLLDRLSLDQKKIQTMANELREVAALPDPVGAIISTWTQPNGLIISQIRVPLGVVGVIYESRPNVTSDAAGICIKSGNAVILRGGTDALNSNVTIGEILRDALTSAGIPRDAIQIINSPERSAAEELMGMRRYIDVLIPRGGADLINTVVEKSRIPVIETGTGNCHIYIEEDANLEKATPIIINAKVQRPGVCNAAEKLLIHKNIAQNYLPSIITELRRNGVEVRGDEKTCKIVPDIKTTTEQDWYTEYLDLIIAIKIVDNLNEAITHINKYSTHHSDSILTQDFIKATQFLKEVDSAAVYWNTSTRFTDGNQFGLGTEIGVSTQKLHARGPMSLQHLTTTKYIVISDGQIRK